MIYIGGTSVLPFFYLKCDSIATMTFQLDQELSAVNAILGAIGQAPVTNLNFENPEVGLIYDIFQQCNVDVQNEGWHFNSEYHWPAPVEQNGTILVPQNCLRMDVSGGKIWRTTDVVKRNNVLYDKLRHSNDFSAYRPSVACDMVWLLDFEKIPAVFQRYITLMASVRAATQLVTNPDLTKLLTDQLGQARSSCIEYDTDVGDPTFMGWPEHTAYRPFQPFQTLNRVV